MPLCEADVSTDVHCHIVEYCGHAQDVEYGRALDALVKAVCWAHLGNGPGTNGTHTHIARTHMCIHLHSLIWIRFADDQIWSYMDLA